MIGVYVGKAQRCFAIDRKLLFSRAAMFQDLHDHGRVAIVKDFAICTRNNRIPASGPTFCKHPDCILRAHGDQSNDLVKDILAWPSIDPDTFEVYRSWLYRQNIPPYHNDFEAPARGIRLIKAHIFVDSLNDFDFRTAVRNAIVDDCAEAGLSTRAVACAYKHTDEACPVRDFLCQLYCCFGQPSSLDDKLMPSAFIKDMAKLRITEAKEVFSAAGIRQQMLAAGQLGPLHTVDKLRGYSQVAFTYAIKLEKASKHPLMKLAVAHLPSMAVVKHFMTPSPDASPTASFLLSSSPFWG